jgi:hypothetical protein
MYESYTYWPDVRWYSGVSDYFIARLHWFVNELSKNQNANFGTSNRRFFLENTGVR